jgi:pentatricopeptide repeat domain-containing protein 1
VGRENQLYGNKTQPFRGVDDNRADMIKAIERWGKHKEYHQIIAFLTKITPQIDVEVCNLVLSVLASNGGHLIHGRAVLDLMKRSEVLPTSVTLTQMFRLCNDIEEAYLMKQQLSEEYFHVAWDESVWESALFASSRNLAGADRKRAWSIVDEFLNEMKSLNLVRNKAMYLPLLLVASETRDISRALAYYEDMKRNKIHMSDALWGALLQVCASAANDEEALKIMKDMRDKEVMLNVLHCTSYLNALARNDRIETAIDFLHFMANSPKSSQTASFGGIFVDLPDMICIRAVLRACTENESYQTALSLFDDIRNGCFGPNVALDETCYNILLAACPNADETKKLIREMNLSRRHRKGAIPPSKVSYTRAISVCRKSKDVDSALYFLKHAQDNGVPPDLQMYTAAIWVAAEAENIRCATKLFREMKEKGILPSLITYNGLITAYARKGDADAALELYFAALNDGVETSRPTSALLASTLRKMGEADTRIKSIEKVISSSPGDELDSQSLGPILILAIETYASLGRVKDALYTFHTIQIPCDVGCLRAITCALSVNPDYWSEAVAIIHSSDTVVGLAPSYIDPVSLGYAMIACSKANKWEEALVLFRLYGDWKTPNVALNSLISACGRSGRADIALEVLNDMYKPDLLSYRKAMIACNQAEHEARRVAVKSGSTRSNNENQEFQWWECALSLLRRMKEDGLKPDMPTYSSAISACEAAGKWQRALSILQTAIQDSHDDSLNLYCFNAALAACEKGGAWVEALDLFERMKQMNGKGLSPNVVTYGSLILALENAGQKEMALSLFRDAMRKDVVKPWRNTRDEKGNYMRAMDLHSFSAAMARAAVRNHLEQLRRKSPTDVFHDLVIVVGKGLRSGDERPVLRNAAEEVLMREYGLTSEVDSSNNGRLVVKGEAIKSMVARWNS